MLKDIYGEEIINKMERMPARALFFDDCSKPINSNIVVGDAYMKIWSENGNTCIGIPTSNLDARLIKFKFGFDGNTFSVEAPSWNIYINFTLQQVLSDQLTILQKDIINNSPDIQKLIQQ